MGPWHGCGMGLPWMWIFPVMGLCVMIALLCLIARCLHGPSGAGCGSGRSDRTASESAMEVLKRRYAGGEIRQEEFERMKQDIS